MQRECWAKRLLRNNIIREWEEGCEARLNGLCCIDCTKKCRHICTLTAGAKPNLKLKFVCYYYKTKMEIFCIKLFGRK